jgi:hypothetical protein
MASENTKALSAIALDLIATAFPDRPPPKVMSDSKQLSDTEYTEVMSYEGMRWQDVTFELVEDAPDAFFWFAPEAFCYYLPGILAAGLRDNRWDSNAYDSLIGTLDRSPEPDYWDDFFLPRFELFSPLEIDAIAAWVKWLESVQPDAYLANSYARALETLHLLKVRQARRCKQRV